MIKKTTIDEISIDGSRIRAGRLKFNQIWIMDEMASFKAHISFGLLTAVVVSAVLVVIAWTSIIFAPLIFLLVVVGSMLPDIDSDTGLPVRILFGTLAVAAMIGSLFYLGNVEQDSLKQQILFAVVAGLFVYFVLGAIFRRFTAHRGIFHSIPAAILMGLIAMSVATRFHLEPKTALAIGFALTAGYLCHLVLDELNSAVNLSGVPFVPKKSLGSALQVWSKSRSASIAIYCALLFFLFINIDLLLSRPPGGE